MKLPSKALLFFGLALFLAAGSGLASTHALDLVPAGDSTYAQLSQLVQVGLLDSGDSQGPLTRLEVAKRVWKAKEKYKEIVVAQADMELPPPPPDENAGTPATAPSAAAPANGNAGEALTPANQAQPWNDPQKIAEAEKNLKTLQAAYDYELGLVKDQKASVADQVSKAEADQYDLWKSVKGIQEYPSISVHGLGRMFGISQQYFGPYSGISFSNPATRYFTGYQDLEPIGSVTKEVRFNTIVRVGTQMLPVAKLNVSGASTSSDFILARWISADFNPDFMSATLGDFYEAYTPLTLWNRNDRDLLYMPEMVGRLDDERKYESFLNQEPSWPFRGLRVGTALGWPDAQVVESISVSGFAHMIRSGFNDGKGGWYLGPSIFTDWIFAGKGQLKSAKWYLGGASLQLSLEDFLVTLIEPLNTDTPGSPYGQYLSNTWAHQYVINSVRPQLRMGLGGDLYIGGQYEGSFSTYQDDTQNANSVISDYAAIMSAFLQFGDSKVTFNYLDVGPYYYSPLAQTRQDNLTIYPPATNFSPGQYLPSPSLFASPLHSQFALSSVPRPSGIFGYYDRTLDNVFPYGMATPNRKGVGGEIDVETLKNKSLKVKAAAYLLSEISGNLVVNSSATGITTLDPAPDGSTPVRNFTYFNFGPSFDLGPNLGMKTPLEIGFNTRYENTSSSVGTLQSFGGWASLKLGFFTWWEVAGAAGVINSYGAEEGINGTPLARYSYIYDPTDLGKYSSVPMNYTDETLALSTTFRLNNNSNLYADYDLTMGNQLPTVGPVQGTLNNQYMGLTYELEF